MQYPGILQLDTPMPIQFQSTRVADTANDKNMPEQEQFGHSDHRATNAPGIDAAQFAGGQVSNNIKL